MSARSHSRKGTIKDFFDQNFNDVKLYVADEEKKTKAEWSNNLLFPYVKNKYYYLISTAFVYYVRIQVGKNKKDIGFSKNIISFLDFILNNKNYFIKENLDFDAILKLKDETLFTLFEKEVTADLVVCLSVYDDFCRTFDIKKEPYIFPNEDEINFLIIELKHFMNQNHLFLFSLFSDKTVEFGKSFGQYSQFLGGASAPFIDRNLIFDINTSRNLKFDSKKWYQLFIYAYLNNLYEKNNIINKVGIYYARYGCFYSVDLYQLKLIEKIDEFNDILSSLN